MNKNPYNNPERKNVSKSLFEAFTSILGLKNAGVISGIFWFLILFMETVALPAKLLSRKRPGIRSVGRLKFILFVVIVLFVHPYYLRFLLGDELILYNDNEWDYLFSLTLICLIIWIKNLRKFKERTGFEQHSFFRGYPLMNWFDIGKLEVEENLSVGRFLDPFIIALTSYGALYFLGDIFKITAVFIWVSCSVLLIE